MKKLIVVCLLCVFLLPVFAVEGSISVRSGYGFDWYKYRRDDVKGSSQYVPIHVGTSLYFNETSSVGLSLGVDFMLATRFKYGNLVSPALYGAAKDKTVLTASPFAAFTFRGQLSELFAVKFLAGFRWKTLTRQYTLSGDSFRFMQRGPEILAGLEGEFWFSRTVGLNLACNLGFGIGNKTVNSVYGTESEKLTGCFSLETSAGVIVSL